MSSYIYDVPHLIIQLTIINNHLIKIFHNKFQTLPDT